MRRRIFLVVLSVLVAFSAGKAAAAGAKWADPSTTFRKEIVVDPGQNGAALDKPAATFPFLLRLSPQVVSLEEMQDGGADIRIFTASGERVQHYVESFDRQAGLAVVWVQGSGFDPRVKQTYYLYYGSKESKPLANAMAVFDQAEAMAFDFAGEGPAQDRTRNSNDAAGAVPVSAGFAGLSATLRGTDVISVPVSPSLDTTAGAPFTVMLWVKLPQSQVGTLAAYGSRLKLALTASGLEAQVDGTKVTSIATVTPDTWTHVALVARAGGVIELYVNGMQVQVQPAAAADTLAATGFVFGEGLAGQVDNIRFARTDRSPGYIKTVVSSELGRGLVTFGLDEKKSGRFEFTYFLTVIENVTLEGWAVIGVCGLMLLMAVMVMIGKTQWVGRVERQNNRFEKAYAAALSLDAAELRQAAERNGSSTLSQLYQAGMQEVELRQKSGKSFTSSSIEALKARIDSSLTNQAYGLSNNMVLLTLSISGGPFLGLLGTVVGVMITFAAIAEEGNVNVNAIAPGVAAALLATAAGLAVAIPALFGYNMILTRIKRINAKSRAFGDTLVARISEQYGE